MSFPVSGEVKIAAENDIVIARRAVREAAVHLGFETTDVTRIITGASELARNVFKYARAGTMRWALVKNGEISGLELKFEDLGPGIANLEQAMGEGYSSSGGLGMGLPGTRRLMDEMEIQTAEGKGTTVTVRKWKRKA
jgi:serine/threonine-protein kinase RsbT